MYVQGEAVPVGASAVGGGDTTGEDTAAGEEPRPHGAKKLVGEQAAWRIKGGDYRIIHDMIDAALVVTVVRVIHRTRSIRGL